MEKIAHIVDEMVKSAIKNGEIDSLIKALARKYFLLTGENLPDVDHDSYGFSIQELLDHKSIDLTDTEILHLRCSRINNLDGLHNIPNIESATKLYLSFNQLTTIAASTFSSLTNLQTLDLRNNNLTAITPGTFNGLTSLHYLDLRSNKLTTIIPSTFSGLASLQHLYLGLNEFTSICQETFSGLTNLQTLDLRSTNLTSKNRKLIEQAFADSKTNVLFDENYD